ncbi:MAG: glutamate racemase [Bacteroidales bacterium]|nr:glutamate racemase [Bacteroidales bacterium]
MHNIKSSLTAANGGPIGVFDSGYGGLTILRQIRQFLPQYDYIYLGDNARAPYGNHSFEVIYRYTLEAVEALFARGCQLVILACNTASAKALRTIQQRDLERLDPARRVLGVIRPTVEAVCRLTTSRHVGVLATAGTVNSGSYTLEIHKLARDIVVTGQACPMWVPLVENYEFDSPGADYFVRKRIEGILRLDPEIDTLILACTHYPLLMNKIVKYTPPGVRIMPQGEYVAASLRDYLVKHPEMAARCTEGGQCHYLTTENTAKFRESATLFMHEQVEVEQIEL